MRTCLVGLHDSGKSTALAALWFSVADRSELCDWYLSHKDRPIDTSHWTALRDRWLEGEPLIRTEHIPNPESMKLKLSKTNSDEKIEIVVPDIAGEDFEKLYESGRFPRKHSELLNKSDHMVFFVHVDNYDHPIILEAPDKIKDEAPDKINDKAAPENTTQEWQPDQMHPGSKIVAVLRGIQQLRDNNMPRITVALTAWDLVTDDYSPADIMKQRFPLLDQYLRTNYEFTLLGVSAQGRDYKKPLPIDKVELDDIRRITVIAEEVHHDITRVFA